MSNSPNYSLERLNLDAPQRSHVLEVLSQLIKEFGISGCSVLELGSGLGSNLALFTPSNRVLGYEGLEDAVEEANRRGIESRVANLDYPLDVETGAFDWALCLDVLEHLNRPDEALRGIWQGLRPGGRLVVNVPNHFSLTGRIWMMFGRGIHWSNYFPGYDDWNDPHIRFFTALSIRRLLDSSGFRVVRDLSHAAPAMPFLQELRKLGLDRLIARMAKANPALFCAGHFLLAEKRPLAEAAELP